MLKKAIGGLAVLGILGGMADTALFFFNPPFFKNAIKQEKSISIEEGASLSTVADILANDQLIRNRFYFRLLGRGMGKENRIRPGTYTLHTHMRPIEIFDQLMAGRGINPDVTVQIRRGSTSEDIALLLEQEGIVSAPEFLEAVYDPTLLEEFLVSAESFEGYLFPDTYRFSKKSDPYQVVRRMVNTFESHLNAEWQNQLDRIGMTQHQAVIMASMIEKEIAMSLEAPLVSAVFHNRLKLGMRLQSDPTVIFGMKDFNGNLTREDLMTYTPYNTYRIDGLPPGPIGNPGEDALRAAAFPDKVPYLYFVSMNNGRHKFSETLEEHNAAVNMYQRGIPEKDAFED